MEPHHCAHFKSNQEDDELIKVESLDDKTKFLILAGKPLNEPIAHHGPFVLNDVAELRRAVDDFQKGRNGF